MPVLEARRVLLNMLLSQQILANGRKLLNFYAPVYKPAGMCGLRLGESLKLDIYFVLEHHGIGCNRILMNTGRHLEPFASGLVTFVVGNPAKRKNFSMADYAYEMTIEFGVQRELNCIDGPVISRANTRDLNENRIREVLSKFEGRIQQNRLTSYCFKREHERDPLQLVRNPDWEGAGMSAIDIINQIKLPHKNGERPNVAAKLKQKYPYVAPKRELTIRSIELTSYSEPYAEFRIACDGSFMPRSFVVELANLLGTRASIVSMSRVREGPLHQDDLLVLQPHELHLDYYVNRLPIYKQIYGEFHEKMDPIWANIST